MQVHVLLLSLFAFLFALLLTPLVGVVAVRLKLVDLPDNKRKIHRQPIPRVGGVAVVIAYFGSFLALAGITGLLHWEPLVTLGVVKTLVPATLLIFLIGLADDVFSLQPWHKLLIEVGASVLVVFGGVHLTDYTFFGAHPAMGALLTVLWLVLCTNSVNLIDGLDGLAAGIAFIFTAFAMVASLMTGHVELTVATAPLVATLLGFLVFNSHPASIFLGDSGSLVLGFLVGCYGALWSSEASALPSIFIPVVALAVPLLDTSLAIVRRFLSERPIFQPDRSHVHHQLILGGLTHKRAVRLLHICAAGAGALALGLTRNHGTFVPLAIFACIVVFGVHKLGYAEFDAARKVLLRGGFRKGITAELAARQFERGIQSASTPEHCWVEIEQAARQLSFRPIALQLAGSRLGFHQPLSARPLSMRIAISDQEWLDIVVSSDASHCPDALLPFLLALSRTLASKSVSPGFVTDSEKAFTAVRYQTAAF